MYKIGNDEIKILITDVDGTIFNGAYGPLPKRDQEVLDEFLNDKNYFMLNTGNTPFMMINVFKEIVGELDNFTKYIISCNGNVIRNFIADETEVVTSFDNKMLVDIIEDIRQFNVLYDLTSADLEKWYFSDKQFMLDNIKYTGADPKHFFVLTDEILNNFGQCPKITLKGVKPEDKEKLINLITKKYPNVYATWFTSDGVDFSNGAVAKYDGMVKLLKILNEENGTNYTLDNVLYFGDHHNDLSVFENHKYAIAMGNAIDEIKELAFDITDNVDNGGVWRYLEKIKVK